MPTQHKHFFSLKLILFLFGLCLLIKGIGHFDALDRNNPNIRRIHEASSIQQLDILFLGNSYTYSGLNPRILDNLDINAYSLGINAASSDFYELILEDFLKSNPHKPQQILLQINPINFSHFADDFTNSRIHRFLNTPLTNEQIALRYQADYFKLLQKSFHFGLKNISFLINGSDDHTNSIVMHNGFQPSQSTFSELIFEISKETYLSLRPDQFNKSKTQKLLSLAKQYSDLGIDIAFYELPTYRINDFFSHHFLNAYENSINTIKQSGFLVHRITWSYNKKHFRDLDHLNSKGAHEATKRLYESIQSNLNNSTKRS